MPSLYCSDEAISWPQDQISSLLSAELDHCPSSDYLLRLRNRSLDPTARQDAIFWILKVNRYYTFQPSTASLAVSYLDRFLSLNELPPNDGWPLQLLSVACVSVAAKMDEVEVPLLPDLQVMSPRFVFETRTLQRMELLLMSTLQWRMRSVTPFDYIDHLIDSIWRDEPGDSAGELRSRAADLILGTYHVMDFLEFRPSAICTAAMVCAAAEMAVSFPAFPEKLDVEAIGRCRQLMDSYLVDVCPTAKRPERGDVAVEPSSPVGVLDAAACASCDTNRFESAAIEPVGKRRRLELECTERIDTLEESKSPYDSY